MKSSNVIEKNEYIKNMNMVEWQRFCSDFFLSDSDLLDQKYSELSIYKNSIKANHVNALKISFPVTLQLLGERYFVYLCNKHTQEYHWNCESIDEFGSNFYRLIKDQKPLDSLTYLEEVVALEWLVQALPLDEVGAEVESALKTNSKNINSIIKPNIAFYCSTQGGMQVWLAHQEKEIAEINLNNLSISYWCVSKNHQGINIKSINQQAYIIGSNLVQTRSQ